MMIVLALSMVLFGLFLYLCVLRICESVDAYNSSALERCIVKHRQVVQVSEPAPLVKKPDSKINLGTVLHYFVIPQYGSKRTHYFITDLSADMTNVAIVEGFNIGGVAIPKGSLHSITNGEYVSTMNEIEDGGIKEYAKMRYTRMPTDKLIYYYRIEEL